jgi:hypothetical protein
MSAVLPTPTLSMPASIEERFKSMEERIKALEEENREMKIDLLETKELLAISLKRNTQLEAAIFAHDDEGEIVRDDNYKPIISPQIESEVIENAEKEVFIPSGKYEKGAVELVKLAATMKPFNGGKFINNSMFHHFRQNILPDELKPTEKGAREWKKEVIKIVKRIAPEAWTDNKKDGNRGKRLGFPRDFSINRLNVILT